MGHYPVMLPEVLDSLQPSDGHVYVDGTFGAGGYTQALLKTTDCHVIAIDRDPLARDKATSLKAQFGDRLIFIQGQFGHVQKLLQSAGFNQVDGLVLDIGVSSMQIDEPSRGFSFQKNGPLDMRMDTSQGETAADIVNTYEEHDLADILYKYGEERLSRRIAKKIIERRSQEKFAETLDLADVVRSCVPRGKGKIDPATRTFQALRIAVNDELGELESALAASIYILKPGGRLVVVSFHSLEDRIVKSFIKENSGTSAQGSRHAPIQNNQTLSFFDTPNRKAIKPSAHEISENPRSRSARLRMAIRTEVDT